MIYLDNAATTLYKPKNVGKAMQYALRNSASPGRGGHYFTRNAEKIAFECREKASVLFHAGNPENIIFTVNATHGWNMAVRSIVNPGMRVVVSGYGHN